MKLYNTTLLRGYLAHLQSNARELAVLDFERNSHPDAEPRESKNRKAIRETWELLNRQLVQVLGPGAALKPFGQLAEPGTFHCNPIGGQDEFRINFKALKVLADKTRRKDPTLTLMQSWVVSEREAPHLEERSTVWHR